MARIYKIFCEIPLIMKVGVTQIMLIISCVGIVYANPAEGQNILDQKISVSVENQELKKALEKIEMSSHVKFIYNHKEIKVDRKVSLKVKEENLKKVLIQMLDPLRIKFEVNGNHIILQNRSPEFLKNSQSMKTFDFPVKGQVIDENKEPVVGATVLLRGSNKATMTDGEGKFSLNVEDEKSVLVVSFIGYNTTEEVVGNRNELTITLTSELQTLEELVVVGYGVVKKSDLTGSVGSVTSKELTSFPVTNAVQGMQGRTPGVQVMQNSGEPGSNLSVRIRGGNSLQGSNEPLYVVDGFALSGSPNAIGPDDIESMEILKDASATAIYGSRGANGVVLITTKSGKTGKMKVSLDSYYAIQQVNKKLDLLNATEFAILANERAKNDGFAPYFTEEEIKGFGVGTDWQDIMFRAAPMQSHTLSLSGGNENTRYSVSGNFFDQEGIIVGSGYRRGSFRANLNQKLNEALNLSYNSILTQISRSQILSDNGQKGSTVTSATLGSPPTIAPYDSDGNYSFIKPYAFSPNGLENPLALALERDQSNREFYMLNNLAFTYRINSKWLFKTSAGVENSSVRADMFSSSVITTTPTGSATVNYLNRFNFLNENTLNYFPELPGEHDLNLLGGVTYQEEKSRSFATGSTGFSYENLGTDNLGIGSNPVLPTSTSYKWIIFSYLARANYSYKGRYLLTTSLRADGSSRFGKNHKWGYFPSAALAWRILEEPFMDDVRALSDLKLRLSYGVTGNTALAPYQTLFTLNPLQTVYNDQLAIGQLTGNQLTNPDLRWESTAQWNAGVDVGILRNRYSLTLDYYIKNTRDLLAVVPLPQSTGYVNTIQNIGKIQNKGIELGINGTLINGRSFKWDLTLNFSRNRSRVVQLAGGSDILGTVLQQPLSAAVNLIREGEPIGVFYGYLEDGLNETGAIRYKDLDGDGAITQADKTVIGNPNPHFLYNLSSNISFKGLTLTMFWLGKKGGDIFNANLTNQASSMYFGENQIRDVYENRWTPENPNPQAKYPRISANTSFRESDRYIEDGSFLRLKNILLSYSLPVQKLSWLSKAEIYVSGQNVVTFTKYSWFDPEMNTLGGSNSISIGVDQTGYPTAKTFTAGTRLTF